MPDSGSGWTTRSSSSGRALPRSSGSGRWGWRRPRVRSRSFASSIAMPSIRAWPLPSWRSPPWSWISSASTPSGTATAGSRGCSPSWPSTSTATRWGATSAWRGSSRIPGGLLRSPARQLTGVARGQARSDPLAQLLPGDPAPRLSRVRGTCRAGEDPSRREGGACSRWPSMPFPAKFHPLRSGACLPRRQSRHGTPGAARPSKGWESCVSRPRPRAAWRKKGNTLERG